MIKIKCLNAMNLKVRDLEPSLRWYREHFGFECRYEVEGGVVVSAGGIDPVLSPHGNPVAPLADPGTVRCIHTLGFEVSESEFRRARQEFADDPELVEFDQPEFRSFITSDPDGYCVVIYFNRIRRRHPCIRQTAKGDSTLMSSPCLG